LKLSHRYQLFDMLKVSSWCFGSHLIWRLYRNVCLPVSWAP